MSRADWCAGSVREIQTNSGRESRRTRPAIARQTQQKLEGSTYLAHKILQETNQFGYFGNAVTDDANQRRFQAQSNYKFKTNPA